MTSGARTHKSHVLKFCAPALDSQQTPWFAPDPLAAQSPCEASKADQRVGRGRGRLPHNVHAHECVRCTKTELSILSRVFECF